MEQVRARRHPRHFSASPLGSRSEGPIRYASQRLKQNCSSETVAYLSIALTLLVLLRCWLYSQTTAPHVLHSTTSTCGETFDVVYTWVNGSDPKFQDSVREFSNSSKDRRYRDHDELRYSMRSLERYAPWVGQVYLVTNGQVPYWLNRDKVRVITHEEIFANKRNLPTFSSPAIETSLCNIPGLSRRFLYFNDDVFLGAPVYPEDFLSSHGVQRIYLSWELPDCAPQCAESFIGDNYCDIACNVSSCDFDGGDCQAKRTSKPLQTNADYGESLVDVTAKMYKGEDDLETISRKAKDLDLDTCSQGCAVSWIGDGICDSSCRNEFCGFDAGDCPKDVKGLLTSFPLVSINQSVPITRPSNRNPAWFAFRIDVNDHFKDEKIVDLVHNRPDFVRAVVFVRKWNSIVVIASLKALDRMTANSTASEGVVLCRIKYDIATTATSTTKSAAVRASNVTKKTPRYVSRYKNVTFFITRGNLTSARGLEEEDGFHDVDDNEVDDYASKVLAMKNEDTYGLLGDSYLKKKPTKYMDEEDEDNRSELDNFGKSLLFTKRELNSYFQRKVELNRKVPAHMPHLIDKELFRRLYTALGKMVDETATHKFRADNDMQFSYAYFTFFMAEADLPIPDEVLWPLIDASGDGCLDANEFRTLVAYMLSEDAFYATKPPTPLGDFDVDDDDDDFNLDTLPKIDSALLLRMHDRIWAEARSSSIVPLLDSCLSLHVMQRATRAYTALQRAISKMWKRTRPTYEIIDSTPHVSFAMLKDKASDVLKTLDALRARPTKFVCINDDTSSVQDVKHAAAGDRLLKAFLESWFPKKSGYEISATDVHHRPDQTKKSQNHVTNVSHIFFLGLALLTVSVVALVLCVQRGWLEQLSGWGKKDHGM